MIENPGIDLDVKLIGLGDQGISLMEVTTKDENRTDRKRKAQGVGANFFLPYALGSYEESSISKSTP